MTDQQQIPWKKGCLWVGGVLAGGLALIVLAAIVLALLGASLPEEPETTAEVPAKTETDPVPVAESRGSQRDQVANSMLGVPLPEEPETTAEVPVNTETGPAPVTESRGTQRDQVADSIQRAATAVRDARAAVTEQGSADFSVDGAVAAVVSVMNAVASARDEAGSIGGSTRDSHFLAFAGCWAFATDVALRTDLSISREVAFENAGESDRAAQERLDRENTFATVLYPTARVNCSVAGNAQISVADQQAMALRFRVELEAARTGYYRAYFKASDTTRWGTERAASEFVSAYREPSSSRRLREISPGSRHGSMVRSHAEMERDVARHYASVAADRAFREHMELISETDVDTALRAFIDVRQEPLSAADVVAMYEDIQRALGRMLTARLSR